jgi:hypothetical protein
MNSKCSTSLITIFQQAAARRLAALKSHVLRSYNQRNYGLWPRRSAS